jgi:hypothetical protein
MNSFRYYLLLALFSQIHLGRRISIQEGVRKDMDVNEHERLSKFTL